MRFQREGTAPMGTLQNPEQQNNCGRESTIPARFLSFTPAPTNQARSRTLKHIRTSQTNKNFPIGLRHYAKRIKFSLPKWRGPVGKFSEGQGGLEGRDPSFKRGPCASKVFLSLQGLPIPPRSFPYPSEKEISIRQRSVRLPRISMR